FHITYHFSHHSSTDLRVLHSFPTRRSSDLGVLHQRRASATTENAGRALARFSYTQGATECSSSSRFASTRPEGREHALLDRRKRSEEHTSELQSRGHLVCRLLLEKKKKKIK